jgi:hypothetical protein
MRGMKIQEVYSHLNGREHIQVHKRGMWNQILEVIDRVNAKTCRTKVSKEKTKVGRILYSPKAMNARYRDLLHARGWRASATRYWVTADQELIRKTA